MPDRRLDAGGQHVDARLDRHRPRVVQAGEFESRRSSRPTSSSAVRRRCAIDFAVLIFDIHRRPFLLVFEHDSRLDHVHRRGVGGGFGAADFAKDMMHFGKALDDFVGLLQNFARFGRRDAGERRRHVKQIAFVKRRHELRAEVLIRKQLCRPAPRALAACPSGRRSVTSQFHGKNTQSDDRRRRAIITSQRQRITKSITG